MSGYYKNTFDLFLDQRFSIQYYVGYLLMQYISIRAN